MVSQYVRYFWGKRRAYLETVNMFKPARQSFLILCNLQNLVKNTSAGGVLQEQRGSEENQLGDRLGRKGKRKAQSKLCKESDLTKIYFLKGRKESIKDFPKNKGRRKEEFVCVNKYSKLCVVKEAQVKHVTCQEVKLYPLGWFPSTLDKSLASYRLSSWFLFTFWAAGKRVPDTWCPHSCERPEVLLHASCPFDRKIVGTCTFSLFDKKKRGHYRK